MKVVLLIICILALWCIFFFAFEKVLQVLHRKQKIDRIKDILFEKADFYIVTTMSGKEYVIVRNKFYRL